MALQHNSSASENDVGIDLTNCYTVVVRASIDKTPRYSPPEEEGGEPITRTKHTLMFTTQTYVNAEACANIKNMIAEHNYEEDYPLEYMQDNAIEYCYEWLRANVSLYADATEV